MEERVRCILQRPCANVVYVGKGASQQLAAANGSKRIGEICSCCEHDFIVSYKFISVYD